MKGIYAAFISIIFVVLGIFFLKTGVVSLGDINFTVNMIPNFLYQIITTPMIILGIFLLASSSVSWLYALSQENLSKIYPILSLNFVIVAILSFLFFQEQLSFLRVVGIGIICMGVVFLSKT